MFILSDYCDTLAPILSVVKLVLKLIQWIIPIVLIFLGTIDLVKAVTKGKEDEIKKEQKTLITRAIAAVLVFLVPILVSVIMGLIGPTEWRDCWNATDAKMPELM